MLLGQIVHAQVSGSWELDAKMTAQALAIEKCPPRIVVAKIHAWLGEKHLGAAHKY